MADEDLIRSLDRHTAAIGIYSRVIAASARVAAMQAENAMRLNSEQALAYHEQSFFAEAALMERFANEIGALP